MYFCSCQYKNPTLHLFTFGFFYCMRWSPWFQVKQSQLFIGRKGRGACFLLLCLASAFLCTLVSFSHLASPTQQETWPPAAPMFHTDNSTFPGKESHWLGLSQLLTPKLVSCGQGVGCYNLALSVRVISLKQKEERYSKDRVPNRRALVRANNRLHQIKLLEELDISHLFAVLV